MKERRWAPRMWLGCNFFGWVRMLVRNRFAVGWQYLYIAVIDTIASVINSALGLVQTVVYHRRAQAAEMQQSPLFIIGHWRSGTTLLHELLILDERHGFPTTYECFAPNHFLLTEGFVTRWLSFVMPNRRPMDNMAAGWDRPQEDEFALCNLGQPSPYLTIAFPNRPPQNVEYLTLENLSPAQLASWKRTFLRYLRHLAIKHGGRRMVLKSPPHTCRVKVLLEMFPDARFVHIVRDPAAVFPSTVNLWKRLYETHGLQKPNFQGIEEYVLDTFQRMHDSLERSRQLVPPGRLYEVRYEDLVRDPLSQMQRLYEELDLGQFERVRPALENYLAETADYQTNRYELPADQRALITECWRPYFERYGYVTEPSQAQEAVASPVSAESG